MKVRFSVAAFVCLLSLPAFAATGDVTLWLSSQLNSGAGPFSADTTLRAHFDTGRGFGLAMSRMFGPAVSCELGVFRTTSSADVRFNGTRSSLGDVRLTPITATARYHFRLDRPVGFYAGFGASYVLLNNLDSAYLRSLGLAPVRLEDKVTAVFDGGVIFTVTPKLGLMLDARYMPFKLEGYAGGERDSVDMNPYLTSIGLRFRF